MTVSQQTPSTERHVIPMPPKRRNGRWSGFAHLLMARMKELKREPEVIFWVFIFPLLLALGLGIAFRNKPVEHIPVDVQQEASSTASIGAAGCPDGLAACGGACVDLGSDHEHCGSCSATRPAPRPSARWTPGVWNVGI